MVHAKAELPKGTNADHSRFAGDDMRVGRDDLRAYREAAYFGIGVEYGIASARAQGLGAPSKTVRALAQRLVQEVLRQRAAPIEAVEATLVAAWGMLGRRTT